MLYPDKRRELLWAHQQLVSNRLVAWTSGNCSVRVPDTDCILIKPSGVLYDELTEDSFVLVRMDGVLAGKGALTVAHLGGVPIQADLSPSTDTASHLYIYRNSPYTQAIVHTHSPAATAWSTKGKGLPCFLTELADVFGGHVPCAKYAEIGTEAMGQAAQSRMIEQGGVDAVLLKSHGVLTRGQTLRDAVRNAVMVEHAADIAGRLKTIPAMSDYDIANCFERYHSTYGQAK